MAKATQQIVHPYLVHGIFLIAFGGWGCSSQTQPPELSPGGDVWFTEESASAGVTFEYERGPLRHWLPEIMGGGAAWFDYDRDGHLDLYLVQGGDLAQPGNEPGNVLYRNLGNGQFVDVTAQAGVGDTHYGMGVAVGDYDGNGYPDLYVTNVGPNVLYRNRGDGTFEDTSEPAGVSHPGWSTAAAFVDYDQDGDEDLLVVNYIRWSPQTEIDCRTNDNLRDYCSPLAYRAPAMDALYRNRGDGTFQDVTDEVGLNAAYGNGLGVVVCDFNHDGRIDFFVANDGVPNQLWIQNQAGYFHDNALQLGCAVSGDGAADAGMGVAAFDWENDGDLDLFVTHLAKEMNTLFVNEDGIFVDLTPRSQLAAPSFSYTGFGLVFADFDNDGHADLYVANGRVGRNYEAIVENDIFAEPNQLFRGQPDGKFVEVQPRGGTSHELIETSRTTTLADFDHDGDVDVLVVNSGGPARLLVNQVGQHQSWIRFRLLDHQGKDAIGSQVAITCEGRTQYRTVGPAYGYLSSNEPYVHFGLGQASRVEEVRVTWPDGSSELFGPFPARQVKTLKQELPGSLPSSSIPAD